MKKNTSTCAICSAGILSYAQRLITTASFAFDLWSVIRYSTLTEEEQEEVWADGLHLTQVGYQKMGQAIAAHLFELLRSNQPPVGAA